MDTLSLIAPEIALFLTTCVVMVLGLSPSYPVRRLCGYFCAIGLVTAGVLAVPAIGPGRADEGLAPSYLFPWIAPYFKSLVAVVGLMLTPLLAGTVDRESEALIRAGRGTFDALRSNRAEFYSFFLFSLTGLMLVGSANDLIWLFLALELTSLPTYVMVTISTRGTRSQEAGVKYFFLGALGAAVFLYGFALLYGATGSTDLGEIAAVLRAQAADAKGLNAIALAGVVISLLGLCFKIAAVPMHFYVADVYQGAASGVSAMLAFVPKAAGMLAIMLVCGVVGWRGGGDLPEPIAWLLWIVAVATMFVGNTLAVLQSSVKRMLAYSSVAHSGYMLVGVLAGPGLTATDGGPRFSDNGLAATLFYLLCYGVMNVGAFAVLACLERQTPGGPEEVDEIADLRGLNRRAPHLAAAMAVCVLSLLGLPPLLGFFGKLGLFTSAVASNEVPLAVILGINSAIAAFYYLRILAAAYLDPRDTTRPDNVRLSPSGSRLIAVAASAGGTVLLVLFAQPLTEGSLRAAFYGGAWLPQATPSRAVAPALPAGEERGAVDEPTTPTAADVADAAAVASAVE